MGPKGIGYGCDEEAKRLISEMPDWVPGRNNGKEVKVSMKMPVNFKLTHDFVEDFNYSQNNQNTMKFSKTYLALYFSTFFISFIFFHYYIDIFCNTSILLFWVQVMHVLLMMGGFLVFGIYEVVYIFQQSKNLTLYSFLPLIILLSTFFVSIKASRSGLYAENLFESPVVLEAGYNRKDDIPNLKFRKNKNFVFSYTGLFGTSYWFGKWKQIGDTLFLNIDTARYNPLGDTIIIHKDHLEPTSSYVKKRKRDEPVYEIYERSKEF